MKTISVSEFRSNIKMYLDIAKEEKVIIHRGKAGSFAVVPVGDMEDEPYNPEYVKMILKGDEAFKKGDYKVIETADLWK
jgi:PHD/YefM family antitoxin component YafN of YafNO toxin-antitoxin module